MDRPSRYPTVRGLLRRLSRRVVFRRRWPAEFGGGKLYVSPDIGLKVWYTSIHGIDPELFAVARMLVGPGDHVWDLGVNIGLFSFAAAHLVGPEGSVTGVEADPWLVDLLHRSKQTRPDWNRVRLLPAAVTAALGIAEFNIARHGRASNFVGQGNDMSGGIRQKVHSVSISLDWLLEQVGPPTVIKIDIEGMEVEALRGGRRILSEIRPRIYVEVDTQRRAEVTRILRDRGYRLFVYRVAPGGGTLEELDAVAWNTVALPEEQVERLSQSTSMMRIPAETPETEPIVVVTGLSDRQPAATRRPTSSGIRPS